MSDINGPRNQITREMMLNVAASQDISVAAHGVRTTYGDTLWWREPGGSPIYLEVAVTDPDADDHALRAELMQVETAWGEREFTLWDASADRKLSRRGYSWGFTHAWYLRHPAPLPDNFDAPPELSVETVTTREQLAEFEQATWDGFEVDDAVRGRGRFGTHALQTLDDARIYYLIGWVNGRVVASTMACATADQLGIYGISALPEFRRRGYASALVRAAVSLRPDLMVSVYPDPPSVPIYTRAGFLEAGHIAVWRREGEAAS